VLCSEFDVDSSERTLGFFGVPNFEPWNARILEAVVELQGSVTRTVVGSKVHSGSEEDRQRLKPKSEPWSGKNPLPGARGFKRKIQKRFA
jgi:hypothetical protein